MRLIDVLTQCPHIPIFGRIEGLEDKSNDEEDNEDNWYLDPIDAPVLLESESSDFFIVKAKNILPDGAVLDCYIDICLPERISDHVYFFRDGQINKQLHHEVHGEVICAVPIDCFGVYDLFYSKISPGVGIEILRKGLIASVNKNNIAEDLGYILRDEERFAEAAEMFQLAVDEKPTSEFIYGELAGCYEEIGETKKAGQYMTLFDAGKPDGLSPLLQPSPIQPSTDLQTIAAEIDAVHKAAHVAFLARDLDAYSALFAENLVYVQHDGVSINRSQLMRDVAKQLRQFASITSDYDRESIVLNDDGTVTEVINQTTTYTIKVFFFFTKKWLLQRKGEYTFRKSEGRWEITHVKVLSETTK